MIPKNVEAALATPVAPPEVPEVPEVPNVPEMPEVPVAAAGSLTPEDQEAIKKCGALHWLKKEFGMRDSRDDEATESALYGLLDTTTTEDNR